MAVHHLKTHPEPFEAMRTGRKPFEYRADDRPGGFQTGDTLVLDEWDPDLGHFTGAVELRRVGYILRGPDFGVPEGFCVMALEPDD